MNITLWILQVLLAVAFRRRRRHDAGAAAEDCRTDERNAAALVPDFYRRAPRCLPPSVSPCLGLTRIHAGLVPAAAAGVIVVMISATVLHLWRREFSAAATTFVLLLIATFVAYNRWRRYPLRRAGAPPRPDSKSIVDDIFRLRHQIADGSRAAAD